MSFRHHGAVAMMCIACLASNPATAQGLMREASVDDMVSGLTRGAPASNTRSLAGTRALVVAKRQIDLEINFDFDSARLQRGGEQQLDRLSQAMNHERLRAARFVIEGHTDAAGSARYNLDLSERRAASVRQFLQARGVEPTRLTSFGKGFSELLNKEQPTAPENRRVRVIAVE